MAIEIMTLQPKKNNIAFCYSTKDRLDLTSQTLPRVVEEGGNFDVYLIDGSIELQSKRAIKEVANSIDNIIELHEGVAGGADVAILYSLSLLLEKGYDYIGLIENDVLLEAGWFKRVWDLFGCDNVTTGIDGLKVGAVSARCYTTRIHVPRDGYAVMKNIGAGMVLLTREAVEHILDNFHTGPVGEPSFLFTNYTGIQGICPWQMDALPLEKQTNKWYTCADWFFEPSLLPYGMAAIACTPSMAKNIDEDPEDIIQTEVTEADPSFDWQQLRSRYKKCEVDRSGEDLIHAILPHYDPIYKEWRAFPYQLLKVFRDTFGGGWELKWTQFTGPFSFMTKGNGSSMKLRFNGKLTVIYSGCKDKAQFYIKGTTGDGSVTSPAYDGMSQIHINHPTPGPHEIEIFFDRAGILIHGIIYDCPQNFFRSKYALRYKDLEPYIGA